MGLNWLGMEKRSTYIGNFGGDQLVPSHTAFPERLCIAPGSVAYALADIHAHASCLFSVLRSAVGLKDCERFAVLVVTVLVVAVGDGEGRASAVEAGSTPRGPLQDLR